MPIEKSAGAVIFKKEPFDPSRPQGRPEELKGDAAQGKKYKIYYLLLQYQAVSHRAGKDYWDLPKGHMEKGESLEDTVKREVKEETGLADIEIIPGFKETIKYFFKWEGKNIMKFVTFLIAKTRTEKVEISKEHIGFEWLPYKEALNQLAFKNAKEILKKSNNFIIGKNI